MIAKNLLESSKQSNEICKFYAGKTIFMTGAAGFLGTVLLEILLRCCPDISKIYILLRSKKGVQAEDRKNLIFKKNIFTNLKATNPDALKKVIVVPGDITHGNLDLNENDFNNLINEVSVVFHLAAAISFAKPISFIVRQNVISTNNIIHFCRKAKKLEVLVYTSSAFSGCHQKNVIKEIIYELPFSTEEIIKYGRYDNDDELMKRFNMCSPPFPNFYTFSKCVSENLLKEKAQDLPVCIIRPSIIVSCLKGSVPGYMERGSALFSLTEGVGAGFIRVARLDKNKRIEMIPVDVAANTHIIAAFHQASKSLASPSVYNCVSGELAVFRWKTYAKELMAMSRDHPIPQAYMCPMIILCKNEKLYYFLSLFLHYIPALFMDLLLWISGSKLRLLKIYKFYDKAMEAVVFFAMHDWDMENNNFQSISKGLNASENEIFYTDLKDFTAEVSKRNFPRGCDIYLINGKTYEEKFQRKCMRYILTFFFVVVFLGGPFFLLYHIVLVFSKIW